MAQHRRLLEENTLQSYVYELPLSNEDWQIKLMFDFYVISSFSDSAIYDENIARAVKDTKDKLYGYLRRHFLDVLTFCVASEMNRAADNTKSLKKNKKITNKEERDKLALDLYELVIKFFNGELGSYKFWDEAEKNQSQWLKAIRTITQKCERDYGSVENFMLTCRKLFSKLEWHPAYGGKPWADACEAWFKLNGAKNNDSTMTWIDHVYDLQHNTGFLLNKVQPYAAENEIVLQRGLEIKFSSENAAELHNLCSSSMRVLYGYVNKHLYNRSIDSYTQKEYFGFDDFDKFVSKVAIPVFDNIDFSSNRETASILLNKVFAKATELAKKKTIETGGIKPKVLYKLITSLYYCSFESVKEPISDFFINATTGGAYFNYGILDHLLRGTKFSFSRLGIEQKVKETLLKQILKSTTDFSVARKQLLVILNSCAASYNDLKLVYTMTWENGSQQLINYVENYAKKEISNLYNKKSVKENFQKILALKNKQ
jgi:hypothetical protein